MSQTPFILILEESDDIDIKKNLPALLAASENGMDLLWNQKGHVRLMTNAALQNAIHTYHDWMSVVNGTPPPYVRTIHWHSLKDLSPSESSPLPIPIRPSEGQITLVIPTPKPPEPSSDSIPVIVAGVHGLPPVSRLGQVEPESPLAGPQS